MNNNERYSHGDVECIDAIRAALTPEEFRGFCKGNVMKYTWREKYKGGDEDMKKARDYIDFAGDGENPKPLYIVIDLLSGLVKDHGSVSELCINVVFISTDKEAAEVFSETEMLKPFVITSCVYTVGSDWVRCAYTGDESCIEDF